MNGWTILWFCTTVIFIFLFIVSFIVSLAIRSESYELGIIVSKKIVQSKDENGNPLNFYSYFFIVLSSDGISTKKVEVTRNAYQSFEKGDKIICRV